MSSLGGSEVGVSSLGGSEVGVSSLGGSEVGVSSLGLAHAGQPKVLEQRVPLVNPCSHVT